MITGLANQRGLICNKQVSLDLERQLVFNYYDTVYKPIEIVFKISCQHSAELTFNMLHLRTDWAYSIRPIESNLIFYLIFNDFKM